METLDFKKNKWLIEKLKNIHNYQRHIKSIERTEENIILLKRQNEVDLRIACISHESLELEKVNWVFEKHEIDFLCNIRKDPYVSKDLIDFLSNKKIAFGGVGDLFRIIKQESNWPYTNPEIKFILRGIGQHSKVKKIERMDSRRYNIERTIFDDVVILALNDYEVVAETIRSGKEKYQDFQAILLSNPNARVSSAATEIAESLDVKLLRWGELLGELNRKWK